MTRNVAFVLFDGAEELDWIGPLEVFGVTSQIDMALHVVGRLWSPGTARSVQRMIEYFPAPPYQDVPIPEVAV